MVREKTMQWKRQVSAGCVSRDDVFRFSKIVRVFNVSPFYLVLEERERNIGAKFA
jgi:hypothetical protein